MTDYQYQDEDGDPVLKVVKRELQNGKKAYYQEHWDGDRWVKGGVPSNETVIYDLPNVSETIDEGERAIWIVEGEKDASNGRMAYGICTTTNPGGAGKWKDHHSQLLKGAEEVYIVWDRDEKGAEHAWTVYESLRRVGIPDIYFRCARYGKDLSDHINEGGRLDNLVKKRPPKPEPKPAKEKKVQSDDELLPAAFQLALLKLQELGQVAIEDPDAHQYNTLCPAHDDSDPSLTIRPGTDDDSVAVLVHCFAGCTSDAIATALGLPPNDFTVITDRESAQDRENRRQLLFLRGKRFAAKTVAEEMIGATKLGWVGESDTVEDEWNIPLEPTKWLVQDWFRYSSATLVVADPKAGKTRLALNLMQALTEGTPFLGKFKTTMPDGARVAYFNYDMPDNLFREYLHDYDWKNKDRAIVRHINGGQFPFWEPEVFEQFVEYALRMNIHVAIFDTLQVAMQGNVTDENSNTEVGEFVSMLRKLCKAAGIPHLMVLHHRGKSGSERGRGASTLDAAFDGLWTLSAGDRESHDSPRTLKAKGRGVGQSAIELVYDEATEMYRTELKSASEGTKHALWAEMCRAIKVYYDTEGKWPLSSKVQISMITGDTGLKADKLREAVGQGYVVLVKKPTGKGRLVQLTDKGVSAING